MSDSSEDQELLECFLQEAGELLEDVDSKLIELENSPKDNNLLNTIFRGFHTIKGGAGFLSASALVDLCHKTENLFDLLRSGTKDLSPEMLDTILSSTGEVRRMMDEMVGGGLPTAAPKVLLDNLAAWISGDPITVAEPAKEPAEKYGLFDTAPKPTGDNIDWEALYAAVLGEEHEQVQVPVKRTEETATKAAPVQKQMQAAQKDNTIRIDTSRFDQILNLSGEIGLTKNRLNCLRKDLGKGDKTTAQTMDQVIGQLDMLVSNLQSAVMAARMQPVGNVFKKYTRMARDVARSLGKDVELNIHGADTEVDKTILEELNDPLVHLVRNSVDHGIETIEERRQIGKPEKGTINLEARQDGDRIVIQITDDGRGMRPEVLRQKAVEKGCITLDEASQLTNDECLNLIFLPGFSTKSQVTDISGRGVGMDVVRTNIQRLNGRVEIKSIPGKGTDIKILLPLTLAILPVIMLELGDQIFSLPLSCVREILPITNDIVQYVNNKPTISVRGTVLPIVDLATLMGRESVKGNKIGILSIAGDKTIILAVDGLLDQDEVMIKPLEGVKPVGISGATLSGEGILVLVLDLRELLENSPHYK